MNVEVSAPPSLWVRFWHQPVRAERLAGMRIAMALCLLTCELFEFLPNLGEFFGPDGAAPAGLYSSNQLWVWKWSPVFFDTDDPVIFRTVFGLWVAATFLFLLGWRTRWTNAAVWLLTRCFSERNPVLRNGGDDLMQLGLFLLLLAPCGRALSLDALRLRRKGRLVGPAWVPPWSLRLIQIHVCLIYCTTGLIKLRGNAWMVPGVPVTEWLQGTWWDGSSVYWVYNHYYFNRCSYAQIQVPYWITVIQTYTSVWFESLFPVAMLHRRTRRLWLVIGVLFHIGIYLTIEVGWFGFYLLSFYFVWTPDRFWSRFDKPQGSGKTK